MLILLLKKKKLQLTTKILVIYIYISACTDILPCTQFIGHLLPTKKSLYCILCRVDFTVEKFTVMEVINFNLMKNHSIRRKKILNEFNTSV